MKLAQAKEVLLVLKCEDEVGGGDCSRAEETAQMNLWGKKECGAFGNWVEASVAGVENR